MSAADAPIILSALARDSHSNADSACLLDEPFQGFQHADTRFRFRTQLELPSPFRYAAPPLLPSHLRKRFPHVETRPERAELQSSSCRRFKESRSDRPTNLETRHRKRELDPAKADGTDHQLRVVTWPGVEVVVSWTLSGTSCSL